MNFFEAPIRIFSTFYNFVVDNYTFLTSKVPILSDLSVVFDEWPKWVRELPGVGLLVDLIATYGDLTLIELSFGVALIGILTWSIVKFFLPT